MTDKPNDECDDDDGDMSRIAENSYLYSMRAAAGLFLYFANEVGAVDTLNGATISGNEGRFSSSDCLTVLNTSVEATAVGCMKGTTSVSLLPGTEIRSGADWRIYVE